MTKAPRTSTSGKTTSGRRPATTVASSNSQDLSSSDSAFQQSLRIMSQSALQASQSRLEDDAVPHHQAMRQPLRPGPDTLRLSQPPHRGRHRPPRARSSCRPDTASWTLALTPSQPILPSAVLHGTGSTPGGVPLSTALWPHRPRYGYTDPTAHPRPPRPLSGSVAVHSATLLFGHYLTLTAAGGPCPIFWAIAAVSVLYLRLVSITQC